MIYPHCLGHQINFILLKTIGKQWAFSTDSIFRFVRRKVENTDSFNAVLLVPTGIGAEIGGHAGDATPVAKLLAEACDTLVTHPNVVNASDFNFPRGHARTRILGFHFYRRV